jgi:sugar lactone lactonase YvrE
MKTSIIRPLKVGIMRQVCLAALLVAMGSLVGGSATAASGAFPAYIPFDAAAGETPEGVAVDKRGNVYVSIGGGFGARGEIWKFTPAGEKSVLIDFGTPGATGLAVDAVGNVYAARGTAPNNGVYRVDRNGQAIRLPGTENILGGVNALAFDQKGNLYVSESFSFDPPLISGPFGQGGIWRIPRGGAAELWLRHDLLSGLGQLFFTPAPIGANGIAFFHNALYVVNTEKGFIVRVQVLPGGAPGTVEVAAHLPVPYPGPLAPGGDGIALDVHGNFCVAMPSHNVVVWMSADGQAWETIATGDDNLDVPGSLAFGTGKGERTSLFITSMALFPGGVGPGLVKIDAEISGSPLP